MNSWRVALSLALAVFVLWRNLPGALLFFFPRLMRARGEDESWPKVDRALFTQMQEELEPLGFRRLGVHVEREPLRRGTVAYDFVHEEARTWATGYGAGEDARLLLLTAFDTPTGGPGAPPAFVLTGDHRLLSVDRPDCLCGGMPGAQPDNLLAAHLRRVERLKQAGFVACADLSLEARVKAAEAWFRGWGARELRLRHVNGLLMTLLGFGILGAVGWALIRLGG